MVRITKLISRNLLGETRDQEKARFRRVASKISKKTGNLTAHLNLPSTTGATKSQLDRRKKLLEGSGLPIRTRLTIRQRMSFLR